MAGCMGVAAGRMGGREGLSVREEWGKGRSVHL
jgi:hypothetical protein